MNVVIAATAADWRGWLARHGGSESQAWLVIHHRDSGTPSLRYHEAIEHALSTGGSTASPASATRTARCCGSPPRNPRSTWSRVNRQRAEKMTALDLMTEPGQAMIDLAKASGTWQVVPDADESAIPDDLREQLDRDEAASRHFARFPPSSRRLILEWIATAKRPETRQRRIRRTVELAAKNLRANHPGG